MKSSDNTFCTYLNNSSLKIKCSPLPYKIINNDDVSANKIVANKKASVIFNSVPLKALKDEH